MLDRQTSTRKASMEVSNFILEIGKLIEELSGLFLNFAKGRTTAKETLILEDQILQMQSIELRTAEETQSEEFVQLKKFNPSFRLKQHGRIRCRVPGCKVSKQPEPTDSYKENKEDLFLCGEHRKVLTDRLLKRCAEENVSVDVGKYSAEDFNGYTNLIELLEKAFRHILKKSSRSCTDSILAEVFLNTRNFLFLTNALLNPDCDNETIALPLYLSVFLTFLLKFLSDRRCVENLLVILREVANMVLCQFGIAYSWVFMGNPGAQVGAGIGLLVGFIGGIFWFSLLPGWVSAASFVGLVVGRLTGGGYYDWNRETIATTYGTPLVINAPADALGNLAVHFQ